MLALITGGARSGKSDFAEHYAARLAEEGVYLATCGAWDGEMQERILKHRRVREESGFRWRTVEEMIDLPGAIRTWCREQQDKTESIVGQTMRASSVLVVDCLTLWLTNVMLAAYPDGSYPDAANSEERALIQGRAEAALSHLEQALAEAKSAAYPILLVTNEVGDGIVPEYPLGRLFRDWSGTMNRRVAACCDEVFLVTAGIPVELKRLAFVLPESAPANTNREPGGMLS